jgi:hypothetical protein
MTLAPIRWLWTRRLDRARHSGPGTSDRTASVHGPICGGGPGPTRRHEARRPPDARHISSSESALYEPDDFWLERQLPEPDDASV